MPGLTARGKGRDRSARALDEDYAETMLEDRDASFVERDAGSLGDECQCSSCMLDLEDYIDMSRDVYV